VTATGKHDLDDATPRSVGRGQAGRLLFAEKDGALRAEGAVSPHKTADAQIAGSQGGFRGSCTIESVLDNLLTTGGHDVKAIVALRERIFRASDFVNPYDEGEAHVVLESIQPLIVCGDWIAQLVERAGGRHVLNPTQPREEAGAAVGPQHGERLTPQPRVVTDAELILATPRRIILAPREGGLKRGREMASSLRTTRAWEELSRMNRPPRLALLDSTIHAAGPAIIDCYEWLVSWLQNRPELAPRDLHWEECP
jgi:hypothetical protein